MTDRTLPCISLCIANTFEFPELCQEMLKIRQAVLFKDALLIEHSTGYSMVFPYGVVVHWNVSLDERRKLHSQLLNFAVEAYDDVAEDTLSYKVNADMHRIQSDCIEMEDDPENRNLVAVSHAIAQSIKLESFEKHVLENIERTKHLPEALAKTGRINLSKKALAKIRGQLFLANSNIVLKFDLLDIPEFFWEHPEYQAIYTQVANYLELSQRTTILSKKLDTIHALLDMLDDEQKHNHSSTLEWIIIILIMVEIIITLLEKAFGI